MPGLLDDLRAATGGSGLAGQIAGPAGQLLQVADVVSDLVSHPPGDFSALLAHLQSVSAPPLNAGGDLTQVFSNLVPNLGGELGAMVGPLTSAVGSLRTHTRGGLAEVLGPLLDIVRGLQTLLASDWSNGLVPALAPPVPPAPGDPPPAPAPAPAPGDPSPANAGVLSQSQVDTAKALVDSLPADLTLPSLLTWLHGRIGSRNLDFPFLDSLPVLSELRDPLETLVRWDGQTGAELQAELAETLDRVATAVVTSTTGVPAAALPATAVQSLPAAAIDAACRSLLEALGGLPAALAASDATTIAALVTTAQQAAADLEDASVTLDASAATVDTLTGRLQELPLEVDAAICRLVVTLEPRATVDALTARLGGGATTLTGDPWLPLRELFHRVQEMLENLLRLVDISGVTTPIAQTLTTVAGAVDQIEQALVSLTAAARSRLEEARNALAGFSLESIRQQIEAAIQQVVATVQQTLAQILGPAAAALTQALAAIASALDGFDPEIITDPIRQAIAAIKGVLESPTVQQILTALTQLKALAQQLDQLSFRPVADTVIGGIGDVKTAIQAAASAPAPVPDLLEQAMNVLPESLTPLIDPLKTELKELIEKGPIPLLEAMRDLPKPILEALRQFSPRALLEEPLGKPFRELRGALVDFSPTQWLDVADQELAALRARLVSSLDLEVILAPLAEAQRAVVGALAQIRPGTVLTPVARSIDEAVTQVVQAIPTAPVLEGLDTILLQFHRFTGTLDRAMEVLEAVTDKLAQLGDPEGQLDAWLSTILGKLPGVAGDALAPGLTAIGAAVQGAHAAGMQAAWQSARQPLADKLTLADGRARLAGLVQARNRITAAAVTALPASPAKTALQSFLAAFDPLSPTFSRGLRCFVQLQGALEATDQRLASSLQTWDARYLHSDGVLQALAQPAADLQGWLREAVDRQLGRPVVGFLRQLHTLSGLGTAFADGVGDLVQALKDKVGALLAVPEALSQLGHEIDQLLQRLQQLDLELFAREVDELYGELVAKLRALDPRSLEAPLREALEQLLGTIRLDAIFTPDLRRMLTKTHKDLLAKVDAFDPEALVIAPLEEIYEQDVLPALDVLDIGEAMDAIVARLEPLPDELAEELGRVDTAYQDMRHAGGG